MPSEEFMQRVLSTGRNDEVVDEVEPEEEPEGTPLVELDLDGAEEAAEEESEPVEEPDEEGDREPEEEDAEAGDDDAPQEEGEPADAVQEEEFYLGTYRTREDAERGWLEKEQHISRQAEEMHQLRERQSQMEGYLTALGQQQQSSSEPGEFEAWAEQHIEGGNAWGGASEALDAALSTGDPSYVDAYIETWKESDPFEAARFRTMVDNQIAEAQRETYQQAQPPPVQQVINSVWQELAASDPELGKQGEYAQGVGKILVKEPGLNALAMSGDPDLIRSAISIARDGYRMVARTGNGTPRKVKSSDAQRLQEDKLAATVTTGDSAPERGRGSTPEVPAELQEMVQRISQGEGGFPKLRE